MHFDPEAFTNYWCKSGLFNVVEEHVTPDDLMDDWIYDCSGTPDNFDNYYTLENPLDSVVLGNTLPIKSEVTRAVATPDGWCFEIPLRSSTTYGYLYSTTTTKDEVAVKNFRDLFKVAETKTRRFKNYCAKMPVVSDRVFLNGNKYFFIEPLEATAIMVTCVTIRNASKLINKHKGWSSKGSIILSKVMADFLDETMEYVLGHYTLTDRTDTEYWRAYDTTNILESMSNMIEKKLKKEWLYHAETNLNGYNWASMLIGYDKPYLGKLPKIEEWEMENYEFYTKQLVENYRYHYQNNMTVKDRLEYINI